MLIFHLYKVRKKPCVEKLQYLESRLESQAEAYSEKHYWDEQEMKALFQKKKERKKELEELCLFALLN